VVDGEELLRLEEKDSVNVQDLLAQEIKKYNSLKERK
jgi:hypothetical protein